MATGVTVSTVSPFACPACGNPLEPDEAALACSAGHRYEVVRGVPRFVAGADYTDSFGRQWNHWATTQMDSVNGTSIFAERFERYFCPPAELPGLRVLDAGCGVGAFVDVVSPHAEEVVGFDLSSAVESAQANVGGARTSRSPRPTSSSRRSSPRASTSSIASA